MPTGIYPRKNSVIRICQTCNKEYKTGMAKRIKYCSNPCKRIGHGKLMKIIGNKPPSRLGCRDTPEAIEIKRLRMTGKNNYGWKGGVGRWRVRNRPHRLWRESVFKRDNWTCQKCKVRGGYLEAHHIKAWALYPELRLDINNGITLCKPCHRLTDSYGGRLITLKKQI